MMELRFPVTLEFRIIIESEKNCVPELCAVFARHGFRTELAHGALSKNGAYRTLVASPVELADRTALETLSRDLAGVSGVKIVL